MLLNRRADARKMAYHPVWDAASRIGIRGMNSTVCEAKWLKTGGCQPQTSFRRWATHVHKKSSGSRSNTRGRRRTMNELDSIAKGFEQKRLSRRNLIRGAAGAAVAGAGLFRPKPTFADNSGQHLCALVNPIPSSVVPFKPFGVPVHHHPL